MDAIERTFKERNTSGYLGFGNRRAGEKKGFITHLSALVLNEPASHSGTGVIEVAQQIAKACKDSRHVHVLLLSDCMQNSQIRNLYRNPPRSLKESKQYAAIDAAKLKRTYALTDSALKNVDEILVVPPFSVSSNPAKGLDHFIAHYFECLFSMLGVQKIEYYNGQI
jgi:hypothetical protein